MANEPSSWLAKRAMVLAAGRGERMRPLSADRPKPLIKVSGKALIDYALGALNNAGISGAVVNVHYLADMVEEHLSERADLEIIISDERTALLETGGGTAKALPLFNHEPFFLLNTDSFWINDNPPNLPALANHWRNAEMDILLLLADREYAFGYGGRGDFQMNHDGRLSRRSTDECKWVYTGTAVIHPRAFFDCPKDAFSLNVLFDRAIACGRLFGMPMSGQWLHVGTPDAVHMAERVLLGQD